MRISTLVVACAVLAAPATELHASVIDYSATFGSVSALYFPSTVPTHETYLHLIGSPPELTGTLDGGQQLRVTYSAPAGQQINILPAPASAHTFRVVADLWSEHSVGSTPVAAGASYSFSGLTGITPTLETFELTGVSDGRLRAALLFSTGDFSFQSLEMLFNIPAGYDRTFVDHVPAAVRLMVIATWHPFQGFDPGPLATITRAPEPVPEPATILLSTLGLGVLTARRKLTADS